MACVCGHSDKLVLSCFLDLFLGVVAFCHLHPNIETNYGYWSIVQLLHHLFTHAIQLQKSLDSLQQEKIYNLRVATACIHTMSALE